MAKRPTSVGLFLSANSETKLIEFFCVFFNLNHKALINKINGAKLKGKRCVY